MNTKTQLDDAALRYHSEGHPGKIGIVPTKPYHTQYDLSLAYSPGVAAPSLAIAEEPDDVYKYTGKGNLVAVISNGTAVLGLGNIGRSVARVAEALGCRIAYTSTSGVVREEPYPEKPLDELLRWADVVSVHAPLNDRTRNLIGARELALMKPSAILINVARGGIVDEAALAAALDAGRLAGAGLDVFTHEPLEAGNPLLSVREPDRLLLSPHNAWSPVEAIEILAECIARNIRDFYTPQNQ